MLLQVFNAPMWKEDNPQDMTVFLIAIGVIVVVAVVVNLIRKGTGATVGSSKSGVAPRRYNIFTFRRVAASYGLDNEQRKLLESIFRINGVGDPVRVIRNPELLDRHFERAFKTIEKSAESDEEAQQKLAQLFSLRNALESAPSTSSGSGITSTTQIAENTPAVLSVGKDSYTIKVISAKGESLIMEFPRNPIGSSVKIAKGTKATISFFTNSSKVCSFDTRVLGTTNTTHGPALELSHSNRPKPLVQRRFRRKELNVRCIFHLVFLDSTKTGRKQPPKLAVDPRRFTGTILDISAGGCSIKTSAPIQVGSRLKIEITYSDESMIAVLGQVLRTNRSAGGTVIYIKFLKVPRRAFNNINALVFGYDD